MATLNQLSSRIVNMIGQPDNHELRERVKDMFKNIFAKYIRQSSERHGIDEILTLSFIASIDELDYDTIRPSKYRILNKKKLIGTVNKLPVPIRIFNDEITGKYMVDIRSNKDNLEIVNLVNGKSKNTIKVSAKYISKTKVKYSGNGIFVFSTISEKNNVGDCRIFDVKGKEIRPYVEK